MFNGLICYQPVQSNMLLGGFMKRILTSAILILLACSQAEAEVAVLEGKGKNLKMIHVTHWIEKSDGNPTNPMIMKTEEITIYLMQDGEPKMIIPVSINSISKNNEISAVAWVSEEMLPNILVKISGFGASQNAEGVFIENYRYSQEKQNFERVKQ
nr:hypothetical protein [uncultured bacterium]